jgi:hypothetical protein
VPYWVVRNSAILPRVADCGIPGNPELRDEVVDDAKEIRAVIVAVLRQVIESVDSVR